MCNVKCLYDWSHNHFFCRHPVFCMPLLFPMHMFHSFLPSIRHISMNRSSILHARLSLFPCTCCLSMLSNTYAHSPGITPLTYLRNLIYHSPCHICIYIAIDLDICMPITRSCQPIMFWPTASDMSYFPIHTYVYTVMTTHINVSLHFWVSGVWEGSIYSLMLYLVFRP